METQATLSFRERYRRERIPVRYSGVRHFLLTFTIGFLAIALCGVWLEGVRPLELLTIPLTLLVANLGEYQFHRVPMHHPVLLPRLLYRRHADHHRFFTHDSMGTDSRRDFHVLLFPPVVLVAM